MWFLYLIECEAPNHYYVGISSQPFERERKHRAGRGTPFTELHGVKTFELLAYFDTQEEAEQAEQQFTDSLRNDGFVVFGGKGAGSSVAWPKVITGGG